MSIQFTRAAEIDIKVFEDDPSTAVPSVLFVNRDHDSVFGEVVHLRIPGWSNRTIVVPLCDFLETAKFMETGT